MTLLLHGDDDAPVTRTKAQQRILCPSLPGLYRRSIMRLNRISVGNVIITLL